MTFLRTLRKLVLGETWVLPLGVASIAGAALAIDQLGSNTWHDAGGIVMVAAVVALLAASVAVSARRR
jgi:hypothetical protein